MSNMGQKTEDGNQRSGIKGFTLIEVLIAMVIILISSVGFFGYTVSTIRQRASLQRSHEAYNIAVDVVDRLSKLPSDSPLINPRTGNAKYVGYYTDFRLKSCSGSDPSVDIVKDATGMTEYTDPSGASGLYLYDKNSGTFGAGAELTAAVNANLDHPNSTSDSAYVSLVNTAVAPVRRFENGITYYSVWSVAYMPCNSTNKAMIFVTVYWVEPEPSETSAADVNAKILSGEYALKNVSLTMDKAYRIE